MKHLKKFNEHKNAEIDIMGLQCDNPNCDWSDMSIPFSEYEKCIGKPCPKCGENLLTQEDYDSCQQMIDAVDVINKFSEEDLDKIASGLSADDIDSVLDMMNKLKMKKESDNEDGSETWSLGK